MNARIAIATVVVGCVSTLLVMAGAQVAHPPVASPAVPAANPDNADASRGTADTLRMLRQRMADLEQEVAAMKGALLQSDIATPDVFEFGELVTNLNEPQMNRYLRVSIIFELEPDVAKAAYPAIYGRRMQLKDWLIAHLASKSVADIPGKNNLNKLREELLEGFNSQLKATGHDAFIKSVLFKEFNVQ